MSTYAMAYYHGGAAGRKVGKFILPPSITRAKSCADYGAQGICRRDRVYVTTDYNAALIFAAMAPAGKAAVYRVEPSTDMVPDPDCHADGMAFECERAKVLQVITKLSPTERRKIAESVTNPLGLIV